MYSDVERLRVGGGAIFSSDGIECQRLRLANQGGSGAPSGEPICCESSWQPWPWWLTSGNFTSSRG
jgi:hypothetical protein